MSYGPLLIAGASIAAGLLFARVALYVIRRTYEPEVQSVGQALGLAWAAFGFVALNDGARVLIGAFDLAPFAAYSTLAVLKIIGGAAIIWGLGTYVVFLWAGTRPLVAWMLGLFAAAHAFFFIYAYQVRNATGVTPGAWVPRLVFDGPTVLPGPLGELAILFYFLPTALLVGGYAAFGAKIRDPPLRYRIAATAAALIVFQAANLFHSNPDTNGSSPVFPVLAASTFLAGLVAYWSYFPPAWLARRVGAPAVDVRSPHPKRASPAGAGTRPPTYLHGPGPRRRQRP